ncbi:MAG: hypothetical protein A3E07_01980 [Candidatus Wildermuthbacteria bacterium RIFCSPHIGHO2_12_FULL_45_9]|uniref:Small ribosomal subunit protein bS6 n=1 Tax=Candidatus Wildermuthbacteria bacterium RIFCSPHIGHO2_02_FULL_45_25 TaxID=1802450 RepID=A0A1G2R5C4_9BACT|nr:MAG: hypothetical protein A2748_03520 [Candidatus Wildermuthbacteria bacterium RIFCSPHIGHO2_01_FULL_45_20]OHA67462.1 MAG: hypothetical protein A3C04_00875 [Candidatus Wildermuthbacteria bacterium RIFCSPHIGHO2_02_FULL_45_25]OHA72352.1 MAG: hypothetical protein A3E07_01980 [Candidatus Wildermuthbacteria bacterium RIFCSPHIGHO2_12_FULL_45_9]
MRNYDLTLILAPQLRQEEANDSVQKFVSFAQDQGAILGDQKFLGKKPLLGKIGRNTEGYVAISEFSISPEKIEGIAKYIKEHADILRSLLMIKPKQKVARRVQSLGKGKKSRLKTDTSEETSQVAEGAVETKETASTEEIDKKLEELLGTSVEQAQEKPVQ